MRYRSDINGLRAFAVLPVVFYHLNEHWVPGGYVGVDIFFVISGYLITSLLARDVAEGRFNLLTFYDRRVRRIVPAYAATALVTVIMALVLFPPGMLEGFGRSLRAASIFFANRYFLSATTYFGAAPDEQFLLHTWSLSIEEQFYLAWPLLVAGLLHPRLERWRPHLVWLLLAASLFVATRNAVFHPLRAFFNSNGRFWELLLGATLALGMLPRVRTQRVAEAMAALGLALILAACALFNHFTLFPGASALVPAGGALLVIWAGEDGRRTLVGRFLSFAPFAFVGLISYSLYLWHWPLISLHRYLTFRPPDAGESLLLFLGMLVISTLSWRFIETPFRRHGPATTRSEWRSVGAGAAVLGTLAGLGTIMVVTGGLPVRASAAYLEAEQAVNTFWRGRAPCFLRQGGPEACRFGDPNPDAPLVVLWGDSYADHHAPALDQLGREEGFGLMQITRAACAPLTPGPNLGPLTAAVDRDCQAFRAKALERIVSDPLVKLVVLSGNWTNENAQERARLKETLEQLGVAGKPVLIVGSPVTFATGGGRCVLRKRFRGLDESVCHLSRQESDSAAGEIEAWLKSLVEGVPGRMLFLPRLLYCDGTVCTPTSAQGLPLFLDNGHVNVAGSLHVMEAFRAALMPSLQEIRAEVR